ncbi:hypothetical protein [Microcoleus sp. bin38.metabat.b11b12b14.051]|nr:hypothetical protein [Microcoleus sp. bin38.metabat.b11b12b14.051]
MKQEGRRKREEGRGKKEEGRRKKRWLLILKYPDRQSLLLKKY